MSNTAVATNFHGLMGIVKKSKHPLQPIYEAITNALEAILQKKYMENEKPEITINFGFTGLITEVRRLEVITITDNGLGFNTENYMRFKTLLDKSKGYNNHGSGRIQYVHSFGNVNIESFYKENEKHCKRSFSCNATRFIYDEKNADDPKKTLSGSVVSLAAGDNLKQDQEYYDSLELVDIVKNIKRQFLLRFYLDMKEKDHKAPVINIIFSKNSKKYDSAIIKPEDMPQPSDTGELKVSYSKLKNPVINKADKIEWQPVSGKDSTIKWAHFKLSEKELDHNAVYLCSKGVIVEPVHYDELKKNEAIDGCLYLTAFYGDVLNEDENVSHSVDNFNFPDKKQTEDLIKEGDLFLKDEEFLFFDTIKNGVNSVIPQIYSDIIDLKKEQSTKIKEISRNHGISFDIAKKANICLSDTDKQITDKLYKVQAEYLSRENQKIRRVFSELNTLNPVSDSYQDDLESKSYELLDMIPQQNKEELGRYVIRREMVAEILKKILNQELDYQKEKPIKGKQKQKEGLIHDLIFKRKKKSGEQLNDLWILSEEYLHFDGCSELPLNQIENPEGVKLLKKMSQEQIDKYGLKPARRPDIFLYAEEGKCVLIELKAPNSDLSDHLNQMGKYCNLIANFSTVKIEKFYCYLIGENINRIDVPGDYDVTVNGDWIKTSQPIRSVEVGKEEIKIASSQIEVIKLSSICTRAHRRNKSFADKLGLRGGLEEECP